MRPKHALVAPTPATMARSTIVLFLLSMPFELMGAPTLPRAMPARIHRRVTISGQSAGGSMAMQHLFAFAGSVDGAAIASGSVFGCGAFPKKSHNCYYGGIDVPATFKYIQDRHAAGLIDDPASLRNTAVHLFHGTKDVVVTQPCMSDVLEQLKNYVSKDKIKVVFNTSASHVWTLDHGTCACGACSWTGSNECCDVNNCAYDLSGDILRHIFGGVPVKPRATAPASNLRWVNQQAFLPEKNGTWTNAALMKWALVYVPTACQGAAVNDCKVHVNYHGCTRKKWQQRLLWERLLDLNEYGEANDMIVVYPQAAGDNITGTGCWNWGFKRDDTLFDTYKSAQLATVVNLVDGLGAALTVGSALQREHDDAAVLAEISAEIAEMDGPFNKFDAQLHARADEDEDAAH